MLRRRIRTIALLFCVITFTMFLFSYSLWDPSHFFFKQALHPKRPCSCRHCLTELDDDPWFADHLNRSIHPLMTRENSVLSEETYKWWQSLQSVKQRANFSEVVEELFQVIPDEVLYMDASPMRCRTCAVVGNSGNLIGSDYGDLIDSSKFVFRTYQSVPARIKANRDKVVIYNPTFFKYVYDNWLEGHGRYPSTGFLSLLLALHICDEVSVFGFGADQSGSWHHYWEDNHMKHTGVHDGDYEHNLTSLLVENHKIKMFRGT
ncbi:CMP-N-acetylneuraminate-beta-galactosamide-alpha-2,3-sialyltransferase 1 isoform X2 [Platichthys flesus]|uniref:CMP-N-acetylneuraminate-beta-galactosamide- alpha-2,3-sialyltransferase 1 isoform X2 n=1 Tax=Platichthys flesus TaxID=8260 RepID=UPI002DB768EA|nr:CMP-N-acetylneuraminate-beta-galactosamide-alpha-2,3-sialyltransferase 1 isoform X2 [Platichthys flesus]